MAAPPGCNLLQRASRGSAKPASQGLIQIGLHSKKTRAPVPLIVTALFAAALAVGLGPPAQAQETRATTAGGWNFALTPYIWFAGIEGEVASVSGLSPVSVDAGFDDLIENADIAFMLAAEVRRGRFGIVTDLTYLSLSTDGATPGPVFGDAEVDTSTFFATVAGFYQVVAGERISLDVLAGARVWYVDTEIALSAGLLPARSVQDDEVWADPLIGLRWHGHLGRGFFLGGAADIGGFGVASDSTWQLLGTLGYQFNDRFSVRAGYRRLEVDYENDGFVWDVEMSGPIVGATFRF
jgi:hypothetical protein